MLICLMIFILESGVENFSVPQIFHVNPYAKYAVKRDRGTVFWNFHCQENRILQITQKMTGPFELVSAVRIILVC